MTSVAVLGASGAATLLATFLSEDPGIDKVARAGMANPEAVLSGVDLAVGMGPSDPAQERAAALQATSSGVPYVSSSGSPEVVQALKELNRRLERDGCLVVAGMSWTPGLTNLMAAWAARDLDEVEAVEIGWVASSEGPMAAAALAMAAERLRGPAHVISDWALRVEQAGTGPKQVFFPEPIGWRKVRVSANAEAVLVDRGADGPPALRVRGALASAAMDALVRAVPPGGRSARQDSKKPAGLRLVGRLVPGGPWSGLRVDVRGRSGGVERTVTYGLVDQLPNLLVNPPLVAVKLLQKARPEVSGVVAPEAIFDPKRYFAELGARGVRVAALQRAD